MLGDKVDQMLLEAEVGFNSALKSLIPLGQYKRCVDLGCGIGLLGEALSIIVGWGVVFVEKNYRYVERLHRLGYVIKPDIVSYVCSDAFRIFEPAVVVARCSLDYLKKSDILKVLASISIAEYLFITWAPREELSEEELRNRENADGQFCLTSAEWNVMLFSYGWEWVEGNLWSRNGY